jgi:hypothetical protein
MVAAGHLDDEVGKRVMSNGVHVRHLSDSEVARALSGKSFHCTMCGKCCTMEEDSEVKRMCKPSYYNADSMCCY